MTGEFIGRIDTFTTEKSKSNSKIYCVKKLPSDNVLVLFCVTVAFRLGLEAIRKVT